METRLKQVRESAGISQRKFASRLGLTGSAVSLIEGGERPVTERTIKAIASEFNINEHWLRTGEGEMFNDDDPSITDEVVKRYNLPPAARVILEEFCQLPPDAQESIAAFIRNAGSRLDNLSAISSGARAAREIKEAMASKDEDEKKAHA